MKRIGCLILSGLLIIAGSGCREQARVPYILPVSAVRNNINISIDPRVELMSIVQYLSDDDDGMTTADFAYRTRVDKYFADFRNHKAVTLYEKLTDAGFRYSFSPNFALCLTADFRIDDSVENNWLLLLAGKKKMTKFAAALRDFCIESNFHDFYVSNEDYYWDNVYRVAAAVGDWDYISEIESYYGMHYKSFNILPVPLYGGGGGLVPHVERDGQIEIYSILCAFDDQMHGEVPRYGFGSVFKLLQRHEFSHSFVNRITEMYMDAVLEYEYLLAPIQAEMDKLHYGSWIACFNEHVVRAVTTRLAFADSVEEGNKALTREREAGFIYIDVLTQALAEYENNRDIYPDLISFYPNLLEALGH